MNVEEQIDRLLCTRATLKACVVDTEHVLGITTAFGITEAMALAMNEIDRAITRLRLE